MANKVSIIINAKDDATKVLGKVGGGLKKIGGLAAKGAGLFAGATAGMGAAMAKLAIDAAPLVTLRTSFDNLAESAGFAGDEMLVNLQRASAGMVTQRDLMTSFNKAAQLVGEDFAVRLPDAMKSLGKVSAATGDDMGFLLDSLVVGVGRLSPMILDNLGIQVSLAEATEEAASMFGVQADQLTKSQTQAGMMNVVLAKLAENTAALPDVAGSAAATFGTVSTVFKDLKDQIGVGLLPMFTGLAEGLSRLVLVHGPRVVGIFTEFGEKMQETIGPAILVVNDALARIGEALGVTSGEVTGMDVVLGALSKTLDAVVIGIEAGAVTMSLLALAVEAIVGFLGKASEAFQKFSADAQAFTGAIPAVGGAGAGGIGAGGLIGPGMQFGGVVPGPVGAPQPIVAHGGEQVIPVGGGGAPTVNVFVGGEQVDGIISQRQGARANQMGKMGGRAAL